ncbi:MAG: hypothetical protein RJQ14_24680, partial [Marinoscillum sp.]
KQDIEEANYRFGRATLRYPSPHAFINQAGTFAKLNEATPSLISLKEGLLRFPDNPQLQNNLGLTYADMGKKSQAVEVLSKSTLKGEWTNANLVNLWKVVDMNADKAADDFDHGNLAVKTNVLYAALGTDLRPELDFDTTYIYPSYPLHRLAFLINASSYFSNPEIPEHLIRSLRNPVSEEMYRSAQKAAAMAYFGQGNINQALFRLDILTIEVSGKLKSNYLNEMGMIALSQHAITEALRFFELAIAEGSEAALLNKQACLLELGDMKAALDWSGYLISIDSAYVTLANDLRSIQDRTNLSDDLQLYRLYYFYQEYSNAEISALLNEADRSYALSLWTKISSELLDKAEFEQIKEYRAVFNPYLSQDSFSETDLLLALENNSSYDNDHPVSKALAIGDTTLRIRSLVEIADKNALNQPIVLAIVKKLEKLDQAAAYEVLVKASDINKSNVALRKQYVLTATRAGLKNYAADILAELKTRLSSAEYDRFYQQYLAEKEALEHSDW